MSSNESFWSNRLRIYGHTGWSDPIVYAYDQLERLALIRTAISSKTINPGRTALDFGCGIGDFSKLLLNIGFNVCGYDPFVRPKLCSAAFTYAKSYEQISLDEHVADLALSITTLDHIMCENSVLCAIAIIKKHLKGNGVFYMLEYAVDSDDECLRLGEKSNYQSFRTLKKWTDLLEQNAFSITSVVPVAHPVCCPSFGYLLYNRSPLTRLLRRLSKHFLGGVWIDGPLRWNAARFVSKQWDVATPNGPSPLKLIRCVPLLT